MCNCSELHHDSVSKYGLWDSLDYCSLLLEFSDLEDGLLKYYGIYVEAVISSLCRSTGASLSILELLANFGS